MKEDKQKKVVGIRTVMYWLFVGLVAVMTIFAGVVTIKAGQILIGFLFLVLAGFIFIPKEKLRISRPLKATIFIIIYLALLVISGLKNPPPVQKYENYTLQQPFNTTYGRNTFLMTISDIKTETKIIVGGKNYTTSGFYLFVNGNVKNLEKSPADFMFKSELRDNKDNLYTLFAFDMIKGQLQPGIERKFSAIFEIPKEASGLKFIVKDKTIKAVSLGR